ncbi:hypothetical protein [Alsobacter sp. R-9]
MPNHVILVAVVVLLLPMFYLLIASPAFLLVKLDVHPVGWLLRTQFYGYFAALIAISAVGAAAIAVEGHVVQAEVLAAIAAVALVWRSFLLRRLDAALADGDAGIPGTGERLRRLHVIGMAANAVLLVTVVAFVPRMIGT